MISGNPDPCYLLHHPSFPLPGLRLGIIVPLLSIIPTR